MSLGQLITTIRPVVVSKRRAPQNFEVSLGGAPWAELDAETIVREGLRTGDAISAERAAAILFSDQTLRARRAAAVRLALRPRTRRELEVHLAKKKFPEAAAAAALDQLAATGALSDAAAAERHIRKRGREGGAGPRKLEAELAALGVNPEDAEKALAAHRQPEAARAACLALARKKAARYAPLADARNRSRLAAFLARRGFGHEEIYDALRTLAKEAAEPAADAAADTDEPSDDAG